MVDCKLPLRSFIMLIITLTEFTSLVSTEVYVVIVEGDPVVHYYRFSATSAPSGKKRNVSNNFVAAHVAYLTRKQDFLLESTFAKRNYKKLYSYHHLINGFAVDITPEQADVLVKRSQVLHMEKDTRLTTMTTHTPEYLGLPTGCWAELEGGLHNAGEGTVIGLVDTGVDPRHPSFSDQVPNSYKPPISYSGKCEVTSDFPEGSCNNKLVGARHFAAAAISAGEFNASINFASPLDENGHGSHTASTAAGNNGVPVVLGGFNYGNASGMAPRAHIAEYKALYRNIGGFFADVVAALEQAVIDGVDIISLSLGPTSTPRGTTYLQLLDVAMLSVIKAGIFVTQAAGNSGPYPKTILSYSPWIVSVAASTHDRTYPNFIFLGDKQKFPGNGITPGTDGEGMYNLILASDGRMRNLSNLDVDDCQDPDHFDIAMVEGKIMICTYSFRFSLGISNIGGLISTAHTLKAAGVVFLISSEMTERQRFIPVAVEFPAITIPSVNDSLAILKYYYTSRERSATGVMIGTGAQAKILGGQQANFSSIPPQVTTFSSRGPDVDSSDMNVADLLKPNIMAPGHLIWAAWSSIGESTSDGLKAQNFAMISGTSMATPHIAGIAALVKQKYPDFSPAAIASAMATTAFVVDSSGKPLLAQHPSNNVTEELGTATPFDFGAGAVNATAALDPGLIFDAGYEDYITFLCSIPGLSNSTIFLATRSKCVPGTNHLPSDLNTPSLTIANLTGSRVAVRTVTNVASKGEIYTASVTEPTNVSIKVEPEVLSIEGGEAKPIALTLTATRSSAIASFGSLLLRGNEGHMVRIPIAVLLKKPVP
ncbi:hypothetical protein O6H91_04G104400 [Diphasiastrum complanatum]|uniref:Uncharacterized protein n=3 Tax=Diphasiastrum complanatum TaxID=34168 RepID=A0ACC2E047_DIPCM|nr:hypothetical protein O6H91_04G104400 [Diphasiastrum complanatum]